MRSKRAVEGAVAGVSVKSALIAGTKVEEATLVVGLSTASEVMSRTSALAAVTATITREGLVASSGLLNH